MKKYDVIIAGASTTGSWFAEKMAEQGFKVLLIEKNSRENISRGYDIFHMAKEEMKKFGYPLPKKGDADYAFEFTGGSAFSAYGHYPKKTYTETVGMHKHDYILRLNDNAVSAGAELKYEAAFSDFLYNEEGKIIGVKYITPDGEEEAYASLVADCTGIPSAARRKLPDGYGVENFRITPRDMFYVIIYYVRYPKSHEKVIHTDSCLQYKCWSAPSADEDGGILGVGANLSFEYAEEMFKVFSRNVSLSPYEIIKEERGTTPYRRPPYSFVADGFIAMGDAACLTKPNNGEGCISSIYQAEIAVDVISKALREGGYLTKERLWSINKRYIDVQGKAFASNLAMLTGAAGLNAVENEYFFKHDIIFNEKMFQNITGGISFSIADIAKMLHYVSLGVASGKIRVSFLISVAKALLNGMNIASHYAVFPETPEGFDEWVKKADMLWAKVGSMADKCDEEIIKRIENRSNKDREKITV